ncbi:MAG: sigma-54 dependent transcriptional regulator [Puniceicoccales bacterium]|jgi:DNA-binding NtrC family response regulator|nr:sigma-54 dependent transcriptional regulator [Puniceicoccales bacterium]
MLRLLIVDDEKNARDGLAEAFRDRYVVQTAASGMEAIRLLSGAVPPIDLVLTDLRMAGKSGLDVVAFCRSLQPPPPCILMTAYGDIAMAVQAMKQGAADFLAKPLDLDAVEVALQKALEERSSQSQPPKEGAGGPILGNSPAMAKVLELVRKVAPSEAAVLLTGETGVGKELLAREIHRLSSRRGGPFFAVNGAAIPRDMVESALFGHERGAFTDAYRQHRGYFERASGGTLLLDEVGELSPETQVKLLRVLETRTFERLGGQETLTADLRLVAATNVPLEELVRSGQFRSDLYYRLCVVPIAVPSLRERAEDIPLLLDHFFRRADRPPTIRRDALALLQRYRWPGNVRELRNFCESIAILRAGEVLCAKDLDGRFRLSPAELDAIPLPCGELDSDSSALRRALETAGENRARAAKILGISRSTLYRRMRREGL